MEIRESAEMYLETIYVLSTKGSVRSIDIVKEMGFSRPTVSISVHNLEKDGYLHISEAGIITLTEKGLETAKKVYERHTVLTQFLQELGVSPKTAAADACKIEHDISQETLDCIKKALK